MIKLKTVGSVCSGQVGSLSAEFPPISLLFWKNYTVKKK